MWRAANIELADGTVTAEAPKEAEHGEHVSCPNSYAADRYEKTKTHHVRDC